MSLTDRIPPEQPILQAADAEKDPAFKQILLGADDKAWERAMEDLTRRIRAVARAHRLRPHDVEEVLQTTWLRLLEHRNKIRDPAALGAWLQTTARRESLRILRLGAQVQLTDPETLTSHPDSVAEAHAGLEATERREALSDAIEMLPARQRALIQTLLSDEEWSYAAIASSLDIPIGSIGPTRARGFERLRQDYRLATVIADGNGAVWQKRTSRGSCLLRSHGYCDAQRQCAIASQQGDFVVSALSAQQLERVGERLEAFAREMFAGAMRRAEQRTWGVVYLRGLMLKGGRKSIQPMAARLREGNEQALQQFVNQSPWSWARVRENLARRMTAELRAEAWIVNHTDFPKKGRWSVGVARQYSHSLRKVENCQVGVSISAAAPSSSCPLNWRIFLPHEWDHDEKRRSRAHLPDDIHHREKYQLTLEMIDELRAWGVAAPGVIYAPADNGRIAAFRRGLERRGLQFMVEIGAASSAIPTDAALISRPGARSSHANGAGAARPLSVKEIAIGAAGGSGDSGNDAACPRGQSRFVATRVRPYELEHLGVGAGSKQPSVLWLLAEWPVDAPEPTQYWLSNLPSTSPLGELVRLATLRVRTQDADRRLADELGLSHFEGRCYRGWHHHTTLFSVAHAFLTLRARSAQVGEQRLWPLE